MPAQPAHDELVVEPRPEPARLDELDAGQGECGFTASRGAGQPRPREDLRDQRALRLRVVVDVVPLALGEPVLQLAVRPPVRLGGAQAVAELEVAGAPRGAGDPQVHVHVALRGAEHAMPLLVDAQHVAGRLERRAGVRVGRVGDRDEDVDDRLGVEARDGGRADVLDPLRGRPQRGGDPLALGREPLRPLRAVRRQPHPPALRAADEPEAHRRHVNGARRALETRRTPGLPG